MDTQFEEMHRQMQTLKEKLDKQEMVSDRLLRKSYRSGLNSLQWQARRQTILGVVAVLMPVIFPIIGFSTVFFIISEVLMAACLIATVVVNSRLPRMDQDLVSAARDLTRFKAGYVDWLKYGIVIAIFLLSWLVTETIVRDFSSEMKIAFLAGVSAGAVLGAVFGLKMRNQIIRSAEEIIAQIEELEG